MNKALIGLVVLLVSVYFSWDRLASATYPAMDFSAIQPQDVVLYATSWCAYCAKTRNYFKENNIPFIEYDIEKSIEGRAQYDQLRGEGVPLIVVYGKLIRGYNLSAIRSALTKAANQ